MHTELNPIQRETNMRYEIGGYWIFRAGGKRKALPLLKRFIPNDVKVFSRIAKEADFLGVFKWTNNINDLDWSDGSDLRDGDAADEFDTYTVAGGEQYILENFTDPIVTNYTQVWFLRFKNHFHRENCRDKFIENIKICSDQGMKCSYSEDLFREIPSGIFKLGGDTIEETMNRPVGSDIERNMRFIVDNLRIGPEHALFKLVK